MNPCPECKVGVLRYVGEEKDVLPTPPGTNWPSIPRTFDVYKCSSCGYVSREQRLLSTSKTTSPNGMLIAVLIGISMLLACIMMFGGGLSQTGGGLFSVVSWGVGILLIYLVIKNKKSG